MGAVWSREPEPATLDNGTDDAHVNFGTSRKRKTHQFDTPIETPHPIAPTPSEMEPQAINTTPDSTPDGDTHKYIVRCSTIFWSTRKDIIKQLAKIPDMPPHGGLHKITKWDHFFITFPNATCAQIGVRKLSAHNYRGEPWRVCLTTEHSAKRVRIDHVVDRSTRPSSMPDGQCRSAADVTAKWRDIPYDQQISRKTRKWLDALRFVTKHLRKEVKSKGLIPWLDDALQTSRGKSQASCCPLERVITADESTGRSYYRNKNEFTIGLSPDTCGMQHTHHKSEVTVGYALGLVRDGQVSVGPLDDDCMSTGRKALDVAECLTPVIRSLDMPIYDKRTHKGYWRQITCREGVRTGQLIVSVMVSPSSDTDGEGDSTDAQRADNRCREAIVFALRERFDTGGQLGVFWQPTSHVSAVSSDIPPVHLYGLDSLHEEMCGLRFRVQPTAFFQVNTSMAEKLYDLIGELAQVDKSTAILDVCCGTGTIGLSMAKKAHSVVGLEISEEAVADAEHNARLNGIENASFIVGKAEQKIHDAIKLVEPGIDCVAILDPPRAGLPMNVIAAVRAMPSVRRLVYVACEPNNLWRNALGLCRPRSKAFRLEPFRPVKAYGVDLFPHTDHGELAVLFERTEADLES